MVVGVPSCQQVSHRPAFTWQEPMDYERVRNWMVLGRLIDVLAHCRRTLAVLLICVSVSGGERHFVRCEPY